MITLFQENTLKLCTIGFKSNIVSKPTNHVFVGLQFTIEHRNIDSSITMFKLIFIYWLEMLTQHTLW